jgi:hypothetical protein
MLSSRDLRRRWTTVGIIDILMLRVRAKVELRQGDGSSNKVAAKSNVFDLRF